MNSRRSLISIKTRNWRWLMSRKLMLTSWKRSKSIAISTTPMLNNCQSWSQREKSRKFSRLFLWTRPFNLVARSIGTILTTPCLPPNSPIHSSRSQTSSITNTSRIYLTKNVIKSITLISVREFRPGLKLRRKKRIKETNTTFRKCKRLKKALRSRDKMFSSRKRISGTKLPRLIQS